MKLKGVVGSFATPTAGVHRSRAAHRGCPPTPRLLTFSVFPAQFSVEVLDDPRQLLLLRLARHFVRDGDVEVVRLVLRLYRLHMVPELHDIVAATTTAAAGSLPPRTQLRVARRAGAGAGAGAGAPGNKAPADWSTQGGMLRNWQSVTQSRGPSLVATADVPWDVYVHVGNVRNRAHQRDAFNDGWFVIFFYFFFERVNFKIFSKMIVRFNSMNDV